MTNHGIVFEPPAEIIDKSNIKRFMNNNGILDYTSLIKRSSDNIEWYWDAVNKDLNIEWFEPYTKVLDASNGKPWAKWFVDGKCNIAYNCIDRHIKSRKEKDKLAYIWEGENGSKRELTYSDLYAMVNKLANALKMLGISKGDVVGIYMPMIPEAIASMLACSKIGAIHSVVFSGFSAPALAARLNNAGAKLLITADGYYRRGSLVDLKRDADEALKSSPTVSKVIVCRYANNNVEWNHSRDILYDEIVSKQSSDCNCEVMDSEDPLFILYTSGTTGKPKGTLHVQGSFMVFAAQQAAYLIDQKDSDILFWPADIGWITGQTWTVYGSLILGSTAVLYDGAPDYPEPDRWFRIIDDYKVTIFGASPTAIRLFMKYDAYLKKHRLDTLRMLAATGELLNPDEWLWFFENVGKSRCPVMNLSGGTEIGGAIVSPLPIMSLKPTTVGGPVPGFDVDVFDESGKPVREITGYLVIKKPWPDMTRGLWSDPERYIKTYWSTYDDVWFHGDWAMIDSDGFWYLYGRVDDVIKVTGHRIGSAEVESVLASHPAVLESAAIGIPHEIKGESIVVYVILKDGYSAGESIKEELKAHVSEQIGKIAKPEDVKFVKELPRTRTGKIVRRLIRAKAVNADVGDLSSLENPEAVEEVGRAL